MTDWIRVQRPSGSPDDLGPLQLAWIGDAVWEMHQRLKHTEKPRKSKDLHHAVVAEVRACAQEDALNLLSPFLSETEKSYVRRGRNNSPRGPKKIPASTYSKATGFETMVGWLFLKNPIRLADLLERLNNCQLSTEQ